MKMTEAKKDSEAPATQQVEAGLTAKKIILQELGVPEATIARINAMADADLLIEYYSQKKAKPPSADDFKARFVGAGAKLDKDEDPFSRAGVLPKPDPQKGIGTGSNDLSVLLDDLHPERAFRRNKESRLALVYVGGRWRVF